MKVILLSMTLLVSIATLSFAGMNYECSRYVNGEWQGMTNVADTREEAEKLAYVKFKNEIQVKVDYVKCK